MRRIRLRKWDDIYLDVNWLEHSNEEYFPNETRPFYFSKISFTSLKYIGTSPDTFY